MNAQKYQGGKKFHLPLNFPKKDQTTNKNLNEQDQSLNRKDISNGKPSYLATRDELTNENIFFIAIKLSNNQYIYEWFKSKEKALCLYTHALKFDESLKNRSFYLIDNDNDKVVKSDELISNTLKSINKGNSRTRFSLSVKFEITEQK